MNGWKRADAEVPAPVKWEYFDDIPVYSISAQVLGYEAASGIMTIVRREQEHEGRDYWVGDGGEEYSITHWMELPAPPEAEG